MSVVDGLHDSGVTETGRLAAEHDALCVELKAGLRRVSVEELETESMQRCHERYTTRDVLGIIVDRPLVKRGKCPLDLAKPLIDVFGKLLSIRMVPLKVVVFGSQSLGRGRLLVAHRDWLASNVMQAVSVAVRK